MRLLLTLLFLSLIYSCTHDIKRNPAAFATDLVGIEATFTNDHFINHKEKNPNEISEYIRALTKEVNELCHDCTSRQAASFIGEEGVIEFEDGFRFIVERDTRVVEITATPIPIEDLHIHKKKIDLLIKAAHNIGLRPAKSTGGGHLHFDFHKFIGGNNQLLRDFLVDSYHHSFIFNSYFGGNAYNAPTIDQLPESSQQSFIEIIAKFDRNPTHIMVFIKSLLQSVFSKTKFEHLNDTRKYQAISLNQSLNAAGTLEFRNVRPYQQGDQVDLIAKAIIARRDFLSKNPGIELVENFSASLSEEEKLNTFIKYLNQTGLDEVKYFPLLPPETISLVLDKLDDTQKETYLIDYAKFTAFNDLERQSALVDAVKNVDDSELQRHVLYILLEKTNQTASLDALADHSNDLLRDLDIIPEQFLEDHKSQYSLYNSAPNGAQLSCSEALSIILK